LLVVSSLVLRSDRGFAVAGFVAATLGYGLRSVLTQVRSFERQDQLGQLARVDPLTGLANRRQFDETLRREWNRARRSGSGLALLMIDIDHFKQLNDAFGHPKGDACLREVAQVLAASAARSSEWLARYGGEEFAVVFPSGTLDDACATARAMRASVERLRLVAPEPGGVVTVSIGVGFQESITTDDPSVLVAAADAALYDAKRAGRNRVAHRA
jgi:diguanylate cyclase (GGDEF)-like protein